MIPGGWTEVLRYCSSQRVAEALVDNDYVVIQIDTDVCEEVGFDVPRRDPASAKELTRQLADKVTQLLIARLPPGVHENSPTGSSSPSASTRSSVACPSIIRTTGDPDSPTAWGA